MTSLQMRYFIAVAQHGNFTQAAAALFISQPAITKQISALESELGFALFNRTSRLVELTPAGQVMLECFLRFTDDFDHAQKVAMDLSAGQSNSLTVGCITCFDSTLLEHSIRAFRFLHPDTSVTLHYYPHKDLFPQVESGAIDVMFGLDDTIKTRPQLAYEELYPLEYQLIFSDNHPLAGKKDISLADFSGDLFLSVAIENDALTGKLPDLFEHFGFYPQRRQVLPNAETLIYNVRAGLGVAIVDEGARILPSDHIRRLNLFISHNAIVAWKRDSKKPSTAKYIQHLLQLKQTQR